MRRTQLGPTAANSATNHWWSRSRRLGHDYALCLGFLVVAVYLTAKFWFGVLPATRVIGIYSIALVASGFVLRYRFGYLNPTRAQIRSRQELKPTTLADLEKGGG
ncbi:hypothetical protein [Planctomycetes bacterium K23_9]